MKAGIQLQDTEMEPIKLNLDEVVAHPNVMELLDKEQQDYILNTCALGYEADKNSRSAWEADMVVAFKLALQISEAKTFPWPNCSNVKFPLITVAAMQFHARACPQLLDVGSLVEAKVWGNTNDLKLTAIADRLRTHMTYQNIEQDENFEDTIDKLLIALPIIGCGFLKTQYKHADKIVSHEYVSAGDLVVDYWTKELKSAKRISHFMYMSRNDLEEQFSRGYFVEPEELPNATNQATNAFVEVDEKAGGKNNADISDSNPFPIVEQHCWFDLDNDGYAEPYIVTFRSDTKQLFRIVANWVQSGVEYDLSSDELRILSIQPLQYFTKFTFVPSPVNAFYDMGFGALLGPVNKSIDTLINQLIDAGTMNTTGGGFLGRGIQLKAGNTSFGPWEWKPVNSTGDDLRKSIVPLPRSEPSPVLLQLLELLINYGERVGSSVDLMSGIMPGQNTKAEVARTGVEQGTKILSAIFKRVWRGMKKSFIKQYELNGVYFDHLKHIDLLSAGEEPMITKDDYKNPLVFIRPAADPSIISDSQRQQQAALLEQMASKFPGFDIYQVVKGVLQAAKVQNIDKYYPDPKGPNAIPPQPNPKVQIEQMRLQDREAERKHNAQIEIIKLQSEAKINDAKVMELQAKAIKLLQEAKGVDVGHEIALIEMEMGAAKQKSDEVMRMIEIIQKQIEGERNAEQRNIPKLEGKSGNPEVSGKATQ